MEIQGGNKLGRIEQAPICKPADHPLRAVHSHIPKQEVPSGLEYIVETLACKLIVVKAGRDTAQTIVAVISLRREFIGYRSNVIVGLFMQVDFLIPLNSSHMGLGEVDLPSSRWNARDRGSM